MKRAWVVLVLLMVAGVARADENARMQQGDIPVARTAIGTQTGATWTGTTAERPLPVTHAPWCSVAATSSVAQLTAATDNQSVSTGCTGACQKSACKNLSQTDILCVRPSSGGNRTCLLPGDSVEFTGNTSCFFDNSAAPAVSGTQYVTAMGCDP